MGISPVLESAQIICNNNPHIHINTAPITTIAQSLSNTLRTYTPLTWRAQPLHLTPTLPYDPYHPSTRATLDWLFFVSTLNFSFWSDAGSERRFAVEWEGRTWDGYWSLLAVIRRAMDHGVPLTDPRFFGDEKVGTDEKLRELFRPCPEAYPREDIPLLDSRIAFLRETGALLLSDFGGSYSGIVDAWKKRFGKSRTALQLVQMIVDVFPCYRDQRIHRGRTVSFWKRAQILVAETWAAFHPLEPGVVHPLFPNGIKDLTMFADYRVPQVLMHYGLLMPSAKLSAKLARKEAISPGSDEEIAIRGAAILVIHKLTAAVERIRGGTSEGVSDVMIDFWLWDEAKRLENAGVKMPEAMRVRGVFY